MYNIHCNCLIPLTGILGKINVIATLPTRLLQERIGVTFVLLKQQLNNNNVTLRPLKNVTPTLIRDHLSRCNTIHLLECIYYFVIIIICFIIIHFIYFIIYNNIILYKIK
jgi:hypothetical protein